MKHITILIDRYKEDFAGLPFMTHLEGQGTIDDVRILVPAVAFFVLTFQDLLRVNAGLVEDPTLRAMAETHRREDAGHEQWFLQDLRRIDAERDIGWLFGPGQQTTRDVAFEVMSETFRAQSDAARLTLPLALEGTGDVFFSRADGYFARAGVYDDVKYFSRMHHEVERAHSVFDEGQSQDIERIELNKVERQECEQVVHRVFEAVGRMCANVYEQIQQERQRRGSQSDDTGARAAVRSRV